MGNEKADGARKFDRGQPLNFGEDLANDQDQETLMVRLDNGVIVLLTKAVRDVGARTVVMGVIVSFE